MKDVFISYKAEEIEEASWVRSVLESNGISCWMAPACIPGGSSYAVEIPQAIRKSKVFVLILSTKAQNSRWVSKEVDLAINEGKVVLPFMLENCALKDDFNFYLTNVQRYAAYENKVAAAEKMIKEIKALVGDSGTNQPINIKQPVSQAATVQQRPVATEQRPATAQTPPRQREQTAMVFGTPPKKTDAKCIWSLVIGAISFFTMLFPGSVVSIVLACLGFRSIKINNTKGKGLAITAIILSVLNIISWFLILLLYALVLISSSGY